MGVTVVAGSGPDQVVRWLRLNFPLVRYVMAYPHQATSTYACPRAITLSTSGFSLYPKTVS